MTAYDDLIVAAEPYTYWPLREDFNPLVSAIAPTVVGGTGGPTPGVPGPKNIGGGTRFVKSESDYIQFNNSSMRLNQTPHSIECWYRCLASDPNPQALYRHSNYGHALIFTSGGSTLRFLMYNSSGTAYTCDYTTARVYGDTWNHVVATYDGSSMRLWFNGSLVKTTTISTTIYWGGSSMSRIGSDGNSSTFYYNGDISAMAIYKRPLEENEIVEHFKAGVFDKEGPLPVRPYRAGRFEERRGPLRISSYQKPPAPVTATITEVPSVDTLGYGDIQPLSDGKYVHISGGTGQTQPWDITTQLLSINENDEVIFGTKDSLPISYFEYTKWNISTCLLSEDKIMLGWTSNNPRVTYVAVIQYDSITETFDVLGEWTPFTGLAPNNITYLSDRRLSNSMARIDEETVAWISRGNSSFLLRQPTVFILKYTGATPTVTATGPTSIGDLTAAGLDTFGGTPTITPLTNNRAVAVWNYINYPGVEGIEKSVICAQVLEVDPITSAVTVYPYSNFFAEASLPDIWSHSVIPLPNGDLAFTAMSSYYEPIDFYPRCVTYLKVNPDNTVSSLTPFREDPGLGVGGWGAGITTAVGNNLVAVQDYLSGTFDSINGWDESILEWRQIKNDELASIPYSANIIRGLTPDGAFEGWGYNRYIGDNMSLVIFTGWTNSYDDQTDYGIVFRSTENE